MLVSYIIDISYLTNKETATRGNHWSKSHCVNAPLPIVTYLLIFP